MTESKSVQNKEILNNYLVESDGTRRCVDDVLTSSEDMVSSNLTDSSNILP